MNFKQLTVFGCLMVVLIVGVQYYRKWSYDKRFDEGVRTRSSVSPGRGTYKWTYTVNGRTYTGKVQSTKKLKLVTGEQFYVYYDSSRPGRSSIALWQPVIDTALYASAFTSPVSEKYEKGVELVAFTYYAGGLRYRRYQYYEFSEAFDGRGLKYKVLYKKDNPGIAYVDFSIGYK